MGQGRLPLAYDVPGGATQDPIAGVDEVGRGCLFGPVVAAAVIVPRAMTTTLIAAGVTDSKKLSAAKRETLFRLILQQSLSCQVGLASVHEIQRINILQASLLAMKRAIARLTPTPGLCLVDGNQRIPHLPMPQQTVVQGDQTYVEIAAASIIAKVWRDRLLQRLDQRYPGYDLARNKGYGTPTHRRAIAQQGLTPQHRPSFCAQILASSTSISDIPPIEPERLLEIEPEGKLEIEPSLNGRTFGG